MAKPISIIHLLEARFFFRQFIQKTLLLVYPHNKRTTLNKSKKCPSDGERILFSLLFSIQRYALWLEDKTLYLRWFRYACLPFYIAIEIWRQKKRALLYTHKWLQIPKKDTENVLKNFDKARIVAVISQQDIIFFWMFALSFDAKTSKNFNCFPEIKSQRQFSKRKWIFRLA